MRRRDVVMNEKMDLYIDDLAENHGYLSRIIANIAAGCMRSY